MRRRWDIENRPMAVALVVGVWVTFVVILSPFVQLAYDNPQLHLALETAEGMIAALLAYLTFGRFRTSGQLRHLALAAAFGLLAGVNLLLSALPIVALGSRPTGALVWAAAAFRLVGAGTLCFAAFSGLRLAPRGRALRLLLGASAPLAVVTVCALTVAADLLLANALDPSRRPESARWPSLDAHPAVLGVQLVALALFALAAVRFAVEARRSSDELLKWLSAGAATGAFARLHYFLFPSLYSNYVYTGDVLRLGSYLFFVIGAAREINAYWRDRATVAVFEERSRVARELHDGLAQELAFIRSQTAAMAAGMDLPNMVGHIAAAAERALAESRRAVDTFAADGHGPLEQSLRGAAEEVAGRAGAKVEVNVDAGLTVAPVVSEALARVVREATGNAVRHGQACSVAVHVMRHDRGLRLQVTDDGRGFRPADVHHGFGLRSMRERVEALGGDLHVRSAKGEGTTVEAVVPTTPFIRSGRGRSSNLRVVQPPERAPSASDPRCPRGGSGDHLPG